MSRSAGTLILSVVRSSRRMACASALAVMLLGAATTPAHGEGADTTVLLVREAAVIAGPPGTEPVPQAFGGAPDPVPPPPRKSTIESAQSAITGVESWVAWGWRAGALTAVHALASEDTRKNIDRAGREIIVGTERAMVAIDALIADLDREANAADNREAASVLQARRVALPLRAARAMIWIAAARGPDDPSSARLLALAAELAGTVEVAHADAALERAVMLGHAAMVAHAPTGLEAALTEASRAQGLDDAHPSGATVIELELLRARLAWMRRETAQTSAILDEMVKRSKRADGVIDFGTLMVARGVQARLVLDDGLPSRSPAVRAQAIASAAQIVRSVIDAPGTSEPSRSRRRASALEAGRGIAARMTAQDAWPGIVLAGALERAPDTDAQATARRLEAWIALPGSADDPDVDEVRVVLARSLAMVGDGPSIARAYQVAMAFVDHHPDDDRCGDVLTLACAAAVQANAKGTLERDKVVDALRRAADAAYDVPLRDQWRLTLVGMLADDLGALPPKEAVARVQDMLRITGAMKSANEAAAAAVGVGRAVAFLSLRIENEWDAWQKAGVGPEQIGALADGAGADLDARGLQDDGAITRAQGMLVAGAFDAARAAVSGVKTDAHAGEVDAILARAGAMVGDAEGARTHLQELEKIDAAGARNACAWIVSKAWRELGPHERALPEDAATDARIAALAHALVVASQFIPDTDPASPEVRRRAGIACALAGENTDAARFLEPVWRSNPSDVDSALALADARMGLGDDDGAFALLYDIATGKESARQLDRSYFRAWLRMLTLLQRQTGDASRADQVKRELTRLLALPEFRAQSDLWAHATAMAGAVGVDVPR